MALTLLPPVRDLENEVFPPDSLPGSALPSASPEDLESTIGATGVPMTEEEEEALATQEPPDARQPVLTTGAPAPADPPDIPDPELTRAGIPQSVENPLAGTFYGGPGDIVAQEAAEEFQRQQDMGKKLSSPKLKRIFRIALDETMPLMAGEMNSFADPEKENTHRIVDRFLEDYTGKKVPKGENDMQRRLLVQEVAYELFDGRGAVSETALKSEIVNAARAEKERSDIERRNLSTILGEHVVVPILGLGVKARILSGSDPGIYERGKGEISEIYDLQADAAAALIETDGNLRPAIENLKRRAAEDHQKSRSAYDPYNPISGAANISYGLSSDRSAKIAMRLQEMQTAFDRAGIPMSHRRNLILDALKTHAWSENEEAGFRVLSNKTIVINPHQIYGQRDAIVAGINASAASPDDKHAAIRQLDAMRAAKADELDAIHDAADASDSTVHNVSAAAITLGRSLFRENYREFVAQKNAAGVYDKPTILDEWSRNQKDRSWLAKLDDSILTGATTGTIGVYKTGVGVAAGGSAIAAEGGRWIGADGLARNLDGKTAALAREQMFLGDVISGIDEASRMRGITDGYAVAKDLTSTTVQVAPMLVGGHVAAGLRGVSATVVRAMSVYGTSAAQGYESKTSEILNDARRTKGRELTPEEIVATLGDVKNQAAAFLNATQTVALSAVLPGGKQRAAIGPAGGTLTVRDFLGKGGRDLLVNGGFRKEIGRMAKNIFADASDDAIEEFLNTVTDQAISAVLLGKDVKLGDMLEDAFYSSALGAPVGGFLPQSRHSQRFHENQPGVPAATIGPDVANGTGPAPAEGQVPPVTPPGPSAPEGMDLATDTDAAPGTPPGQPPAPAASGVRPVTQVPAVVPIETDPFVQTITDPVELETHFRRRFDVISQDWPEAIETPEGPIELGKALADDTLEISETGESTALNYFIAANLPDLIANSTLVSVEAAPGGDQEGQGMDRRYAWVALPNGERRHVLITVKRTPDHAAAESTRRDGGRSTGGLGISVEVLPVNGAAAGGLRVDEVSDTMTIGNGSPGGDANQIPPAGNAPGGRAHSSDPGELGRFLAGIKPEHRTETTTPDTEPGSGRAGDDAPVAAVLSLTEGTSASAKDISAAGHERIRSEMGDTVRLDNDTYIHQSKDNTSNEHRGKTTEEILHHRARSFFDRSTEALGRIRRGNHGAEAFFGVPEADQTREALLAQIAAVATGRKQLFHDTYTEEVASALIQMGREVMPQVRMEYRDGHLIAWRPDLLSHTADELIDLSKELPQARNGLLMGYGLESMAMFEPHALVVIRNEAGEVLGGFHSPHESAKIYAAARLRDLYDATGKNYSVEILIKGVPAASQPKSPDMPNNIPPARPGGNTEAANPEKTDRQDIVRRFRADLISGKQKPEDLNRRAKGDPELEGFIARHADQLKQAEETVFEKIRTSPNRTVSADDVRPYLPGYAEADPLTRDGEYTNAAGKISRNLLDRLFAQPSKTGIVSVLAGGPGSGKTSSAASFIPKSDFTYDTTLSNPSTASKLRKQSDASGREMVVTYIHRRFPLAMQTIIDRYLDAKGNGEPARIVPLDFAVRSHIEAQETILDFKGGIITIIDNNGSLGESREITLEDLAKESYLPRDEEDARRTGSNPERDRLGNDPKLERGLAERRAESRKNQRRTAEEALGEEGRGIIERHRAEGILSDAEADAFLGRLGKDPAVPSFATPGGLPPDEVSGHRGSADLSSPARDRLSATSSDLEVATAEFEGLLATHRKSKPAGIDPVEQAEAAPDLLRSLEQKHGKERVDTAIAAVTARRDAHAPHKLAFDAAMRKIAGDHQAEVLLADLKGIPRSVEKVLDQMEYTGDLKDILRGSIVARSVADVETLSASVKEAFPGEITIKDRFSKPLSSGYRDMMMTLEIAPGIHAEIQIHIPEMIQAKEVGHAYYEEQRSLPRSDPRWKELDGIMKKLYSTAYHLSKLRNTGSSEMTKPAGGNAE